MSRAGFLNAKANVNKMAARFNNRLPSGKFGQTKVRRRGSIKKLMEGLQTWKAQHISSKEKENDNFEPTKKVAITTRSNTIGRVSSSFRIRLFLSLNYINKVVNSIF